MKKILAFLLVAVMAFSFAACGGVEGGTETSTNQGGEPNQETGGSQSTEPTTPTHEHTFEEGWTTNAHYHWHKATCEHGDEVSDKTAHSFGTVGICSTCGMKESAPSVGLEYTLTEDGESYGVTGIGTCEDAEIVIPAVYEGKPVTSIGDSAFANVGEITSVTVPDCVTSIGDNAFGVCRKLASLAVSEGNPSYCTMDGVLYNKGMTELLRYPAAKKEVTYTIPSGVTSINENAFFLCSDLTSIVIPDSVTSIGGQDSTFPNVLSFASITVSKNNANYCSVDGVLFSKSMTELLCYPAQKADAAYAMPSSVTSIGKLAFQNCSNLTSIVISEKAVSIGENAFWNCSNLSSIIIPDGVTSIGRGAFQRCSSLASLTFAEGSKLTSIGMWAFAECQSLTSIAIPDGVTSIGINAFRDSTGLIQTEGGVQYVDKWVIGCDTSVTEISLRENTVGIGDSVIPSRNNISGITIPNGVRSIGSYAFSACYRLTSITYQGTKAQWKAITKGDHWDDGVGGIDSYTVHCADGVLGKDNISVHEHSFEKTLTFDASCHRYTAICTTCGAVGETTERKEHSFGLDNKCTVCGYELNEEILGMGGLDEIKSFGDIPEISEKNRELLKKYMEERYNPGMVLNDVRLFDHEATFDYGRITYEEQEIYYGYMTLQCSFLAASTTPSIKPYKYSINSQDGEKTVELLKNYYGSKATYELDEDKTTCIVNTRDMTKSEMERLCQLVHVLTYRNVLEYRGFVNKEYSK